MTEKKIKEEETKEVLTLETDNVVDGVIDIAEFEFGGNDGQVRDEMAINHLFATGFDPSKYDWAWVRFNRLSDARSRYFLKVDKTIHGKWFKPGAFHKTHGGIVCGEKYMSGGKPEFYLHVRSIKARDAERKADHARVAAARDINNNGDFKAITSKLAGALSDSGSSLTGGITRSVGGWPSGN